MIVRSGNGIPRCVSETTAGVLTLAALHCNMPRYDPDRKSAQTRSSRIGCALPERDRFVSGSAAPVSR